MGQPIASRTKLSSPPAWIAAVVFAIAIGAVYCRSLNVPFILDDDAAIVQNPSITSLWPLFGTVERPGPLRPLAPRPTAGRPLVNLTLAINYSVGGMAPFGYHALNVLIHFASTMLLFAIVRRTLFLPYFADRFESTAGWLAMIASLLWAVHPLQTEAVIYATQRTELMVALFYFATLYCSLRYWIADSGRDRRAMWLTIAVVASLAGMASKEVMVTAPIMILLFERTFVAGSFTGAFRRSWPLYVGLASTWLLLVALNISSPRGDTAGFDSGPGLANWWLTQSQVLVMYLKLVFWPAPLLIHYHLPYLETIGQAWPYVLPIVLLGTVSLVLLALNRPAGFLGAWVFAILAPTSVVPIITEVAAERRMYLPLAAIVAFFVVGGYALATRLMHRPALWQKLFAATAGILVVVLGVASFDRLVDYRNEVGLWQGVVAAQPTNAMARYNLGQSLKRAGRLPEAISELQEVAKLEPQMAIVFNELGLALTKADRIPDAIEALQTAIRLQPKAPIALNNLGHALNRAGRSSDAITYLQRAIQLQPEFSDAHNNLGIAFGSSGNIQKAIEEFQQAIQLQPNYANAHNNLGLALDQLGEKIKAIEQFRLGLQLNPNDANAHYNMAVLLAGADQTAEAIAHFELAIRLMPTFADAHNGLGDALRIVGRTKEAIEHHQAALKIRPNFIEAYMSLARTLALMNQSGEAIAAAEKGINVARSDKQTVAADELEKWLKDYRTELQHAVDAPPTAPNPQPRRRSLSP